MIVIYGTHVSNFNFLGLKILIFWVVSGIKGQKMAHNDKKLCQFLIAIHSMQG